MRHSTRIAFIGWLAASIVASSSRAQEPARSPSAPSFPGSSPTPIFLNTPADLDSFWKGLDRPDLVLLSGEAYRTLVDGPARRGAPLASPVRSVAVLGDIAGDQARLTIEYRMELAGDAATWVGLHLEGQAVASIREAGRDLAARLSEPPGWEVELSGRGEHTVRVELIARVAATTEGKRIELAIPPAASTRVDLAIARPALEASTGPEEPVLIEPLESRPGSRLAARLSPRARLSVSWRERNDPGTDLPVLLTARGEVSIEVVSGSLRTRGEWAIEAARGSTSQVTFRVEPGEQVIDVEVAGQPVPVAVRREDGRSSVVVPLGQPLTAGTTRRVALTTIRGITSEPTTRLALGGHPIDQARVQTGLIAIARSGPVFLNPTVGRGIRRVDPRTELSESLRARPDIVLAFEFSEQPYELNLAIEPAWPRVRVGVRSTVSIRPLAAAIDATLRYRISQGIAFEIRVGLPVGLDFIEAGPADLIDSTEIMPEAGTKGEVSARRLLSIRLNRQVARDEDFSITLRGSVATGETGPWNVPLFEPVADSYGTTLSAIVSPRSVTAEIRDTQPAGVIAYEPEWSPPPADWSWPAGATPAADAGVLWLKGEGPTRPLPLRLTIRSRSVRHEQAIAAVVDAGGIDLVDEIAGKVGAGSLSRIDLKLPPEVPARWEVEGLALSSREAIGEDEDGSRRFRLNLAQPISESFRFRIRYRKAFAEPAEVRHPASVVFEPIEMIEGISTGRTLRVSAAPSIRIRAEGERWSRPVRTPGDEDSRVDAATRIVLATRVNPPGPVRLSITAEETVPMPEVVAPRVLIRATQRPDFDLAMTASFWIETRDGSIELGLPPGSRWSRARVGGVEPQAGGVSRLAPDLYRIRLGIPGGPASNLVEADFVVPAGSVGSTWPAPRLVSGSVMQTVWEARLSGHRAGLGVPPGWTDENRWYWDLALWRRKPARTPAQLASWLTGDEVPGSLIGRAEAGEIGDGHAYLFSRSGPPIPLEFATFSRSTLVLLCSGPPLLIGLLAMARRPPARTIVAGLLILAFGVVSLADPNTTFSILQSSALGLALLGVAATMSWILERRGGIAARASGPGGVGTVMPVSSIATASPFDPDRSTAIRPRGPTEASSPGSAGDQVSISLTPDRPAESASTQDFYHR